MAKEDGGPVTVRLVDLSSIVNKEYPVLEALAPLELAISYVASGSETIQELIDQALYPYAEDTGESKRLLETHETAMKRDELENGLAELQADLEKVPGWENEQYHDKLPKDFYFLGLNNQAKGVFAVVHSRPQNKRFMDDMDDDIPF